MTSIKMNGEWYNTDSINDNSTIDEHGKLINEFNSNNIKEEDNTNENNGLLSSLFAGLFGIFGSHHYG